MGPEPTFPLWRLDRLRMSTDGEGITTLVGAHGCALRCRYCINPGCFDDSEKVEHVTPEELYERVKRDDLYFRATNGGVTFGGGEPLIHAGFIAAFRRTVPAEWRICAETSLNLPEENVVTAAGCVDCFFVDVKETSEEIYKKYTGADNARAMSNLALLLSLAGSGRVVVRLPLIPGFNTEGDRERSLALLRSMGAERFDLFTYRTE
ncbi:MAG: radical SAM protein [Clostridia bacterium]|nr:radical SAM protein [Clostridia bacterium]